MREHKYRGLTKDGEWVYGYYCEWQGICYIFDSPWNLYRKGRYEVIPETVGQYIGHKDKNGVKIHEGDIVSDPKGNTGKVYYCASGGVAEFRIEQISSRDGAFYDHMGIKFYWGELEVIDNIHQDIEESK